MRRLFIGVAVFWILLVVASHVVQAGSFEPSSVVRVNEIDLIYPAGGAFEHAKMVLDEIGSNQDYARMVAKPTLKHRVYGDASPMSWKAYVGQDAVTSWNGPGLAAYSLWS